MEAGSLVLKPKFNQVVGVNKQTLLIRSEVLPVLFRLNIHLHVLAVDILVAGKVAGIQEQHTGQNPQARLTSVVFGNQVGD